ncbi:hypothetical protein ACLOJK_013600 [Asimina triloba]
MACNERLSRLDFLLIFTKMGLCHSRANLPEETTASSEREIPSSVPNTGTTGTQQQPQQLHKEKEEKKEEDADVGKRSPFFPFYSPSPAKRFFSKKSPALNGGSNSTPRRFFKRPFPPPSPAKHIRAALARRHGSVKPNEASKPEGTEPARLDKSFGFSKRFECKYEIGEEVGRGHFGYTCAATLKKGEHKGRQAAVKVIPKVKVWLLFFLATPNLENNPQAKAFRMRLSASGCVILNLKAQEEAINEPEMFPTEALRGSILKPELKIISSTSSNTEPLPNKEVVTVKVGVDCTEVLCSRF